MKKLFLKSLFLPLSILNSPFSTVIAQGEANNWYFGYKAGLTFSTDPPTARTVDCNGINTTPVTSAGRIPTGYYGYLVALPDGKKLATASFPHGIERLDFDNAGEDIAVTPDHAICEGGETELHMGNGDGFPVEWTDADGNVIGTDSTVTVSPAPPGEHVHTVKTLKRSGTNMVVNGDFEAGNRDFTTQYKHYGMTGGNSGSYAVGTDPSTYWNTFKPCGDHNTGSGNMLVLDAASNNVNGVPAKANFWCGQPITVVPNTDYGFSVWISSVNVNGLISTVQVSINGTPIGTKTVQSTDVCKWTEYHYIWNSGTSTTADICLSELTGVANGNDFAVDDISFFKLVEAEKKVKVFVTPKETPTFDGLETSLCLNDVPPVLPTVSSNGFKGTWSPAAVSTNAAGASIYTFTPDADECALPIGLTFYVNKVDGGAVYSTKEVICHNGVPEKFTATQAASTHGNLSYVWEMSENGTDWAVAPGTNNNPASYQALPLGNPQPAATQKVFQFRRKAIAAHNRKECVGHSNNEVKIYVRPENDCMIFPSKDVTDLDGNGMADPGEVLTYTIEVKSTYHTQNTVNVSDDIPAGTTYVPGSATAGGVFIPAPAGAHGRGRIEWNNLPIPASPYGNMLEVPIAFQVTVDDDMTRTGDRITNTVLVNDLPATAPKPEEEDAVTTLTNPTRAYAAAKTVADLGSADGKAQAGEVLEYTITLENTGNIPLMGIAVGDVLPDGTTYVTGSASHSGTLTGNSLNWTVDLAYGETKNLTFRVKVTDDLAGINAIANTATVEHPTAGKQTPEKNIDTDPVVSYTITKDAPTRTHANAGDVIDYVITVTNTGTVSLNGITVSDQNVDSDTGMDFAAVVGKILPGGTGTVAAQHTVTQADADAGYVYNRATATTKNPNDLGQDVTAESTDPNPYNCSSDPDCHSPSPDHTIITIAQHPKMEMAKQVAYRQMAYHVGEKIAYEIVVTNTGNVTLNDITVTDNNADAPNTWTIVSLAPGKSGTVQAFHTVTQADANTGEVLNLAKAKGEDPRGNRVTAESKDPDCQGSDCNVPDTKVVIVQNPGLSLKKKADRSQTYKAAGDKIAYAITVTNTGDVDLTGIELRDDKISGSPLGPAFGLPSKYSYPNNSRTVAAAYTVTQADVDRGYVYNLARATGDDANGKAVTPAESEDPEPCTSCPKDPAYPGCTIVPIEQHPKMEMTKDVDRSRTYKLGDIIEYAIVVTNTGNVTLAGITVTDDNADAPDNQWTIATLAPKEKRNFTAKHKVTELDVNVGNVYNLAKAAGEDPQGGEVTAESEDPNCPTCSSTGVPIEQHPKMEMTKTVDRSKPYKIGDKIAYAITVKNTGDVALTNITVTDGNADKPNEWLIPILFAGEGLPITAYHTVTQADVDAGEVHNLAKAKGEGREGGDVTAESEDPDCPGCVPGDPTDVDIEQNPGMAVSKSVVGSGPYRFGDKIAYSIAVENTGDVTLKGITIADDNADAVPGLVGKNGATTPILVLAPGDKKEFSAWHTVTQADVNLGHVLNIALANGKDPKGENVTAESNDPDDKGTDPEDPTCPTCTVTGILRDVEAADDAYEVIWLQAGFVGGSVLDNDSLNHLPVDADQIVLTPLTPTDPGLLMGDDGRIAIRSAILPGRYEYPYQICERRIPENCAQATAIIDILPTRDRNRVVIPNVFSPNGDGVNDRFEIPGIERLERVSLEVINRWGNRVFHNEDYRNEWEAEDLAGGMYYCIIKLYNNGKEDGKIKSWILVMR